MALHTVRYLDVTSNAVKERRIDVSSDDEARMAVQADGGVVLDVRRAASIWTRRSAAVRAKPLFTADVALVCRELRALLSAGLSVVEALDALAAAQQGAAQSASIHATLLTRLREGKSLSTAMRQAGGFPSLLIASVQASERTSNLVEALDAYLRYDDMVGTLRRRVISAALYPAIVVVLGVLVALFLLMVVIPRFASLYGEMGRGAAAGAATSFLLSLSVVLRDHPMLVAGVAAAGALGVALLIHGGRWRKVAAWIVGHVPWLGLQLGHFDRARVYEALALLVKGGYSLHESMSICGELGGSDEVRSQLDQARVAIERGVSVSSAFAGAGLTDSISERLLRAGDRGGEFDRVLKAVADRHSRAFETFVDRATRIVEPVLLLGVALLVGGMVVLLYMPIFDIAASVH